MLHFNITTIWIFISCWICFSFHVLLTHFLICCIFLVELTAVSVTFGYFFFCWLLKQYVFVVENQKKSVRRAERRKQNATAMSSLGELHSFTPSLSRCSEARRCDYIKCQQRVHKQCHNSIQFSGSFCWFAFFL